MFDVFKAKAARIFAAISAYNEDENFSIRAAAQKYEVDRMTLTRRLDGGFSKSTRSASNKRLSNAQKEAICQYIEQLDHISASARLSMI